MAPPAPTPAHPAEHPQGTSSAPAQDKPVLPSIEDAPSEALQGTAAPPKERSSETPQSTPASAGETGAGPSSSLPPHSPFTGDKATPEALELLAQEALAVSPTVPPSNYSPTMPPPDESLEDMDKIPSQSLGNSLLAADGASSAQEAEPSVKVKVEEGSAPAEKSGEKADKKADEKYVPFKKMEAKLPSFDRLEDLLPNDFLDQNGEPLDIADIEAGIDDSAPVMDVVFLRHLKSVSNTVTPEGVVAQQVLYLLPDQAVQWAYHDVNNGTARGVKRGEYMWDGLTEHSMAQTAELAKAWSKLDDVNGVISSTLTRAIQTANLIFLNSLTFVDDSLAEGTNWPHDYKAQWYLEDGERYVSYLQLKGGDGPDCGNVVRRVKYKMDNAFPVNHRLREEEDLNERVKNALDVPDLEKLEARAEKARRAIWGMAKRLQRRYWKNATEETCKGKIVVVTHGGFLNFVTRDFNCLFKRQNEQQDWKWDKSCALKNGDAIVYRFQPTEDDKFRLVEKPESSEYRKVLGEHYKVVANIDREYRNPDGRVLDHKTEYMRFNNRIARDVRQSYLEAPQLMKYFLGVPGPVIGGLWQAPVQEMPEYLRQAIANAARARKAEEEKAQLAAAEQAKQAKQGEKSETS